MFDYIIEQHSDIHKVVVSEVTFLEKQLEVKFSNHEKSFFSLFFAASYERSKKELKRTLSAIVVCAAGISTSEILKSKLGEYYQQFGMLKNLKERSMIQARIPFELNIK